jgi:hypothetical protein
MVIASAARRGGLQRVDYNICDLVIGRLTPLKEDALFDGFNAHATEKTHLVRTVSASRAKL